MVFAAVEVIFAVRVLNRRPYIRKAVIYAIGYWILSYKFSEYIGGTAVPVDFSAVAYFMCGFAVLFPGRITYLIGAFCGLIAGVMYVTTMSLAPEIHYGIGSNSFTTIAALLNHNLLFLLSMSMSAEKKFRLKDVHWIPGYIAIYILYVQFVTARYPVGSSVTTLKILDGTIINLVAPEFALTAAYYVFYYVFVVAALIGIISLVYFINRRLHAEKRFVESERDLHFSGRADMYLRTGRRSCRRAK